MNGNIVDVTKHVNIPCACSLMSMHPWTCISQLCTAGWYVCPAYICAGCFRSLCSMLCGTLLFAQVVLNSAVDGVWRHWLSTGCKPQRRVTVIHASKWQDNNAGETHILKQQIAPHSYRRSSNVANMRRAYRCRPLHGIAACCCCHRQSNSLLHQLCRRLRIVPRSWAPTETCYNI